MIKKIIKKLAYGPCASSESYINYLRRKGVVIGDGCVFYGPRSSYVDVQYPWMITIGNNVQVTNGVMILTHDYAWSVLKRIQQNDNISGAILGASGEVKIGNNVFIGINSIICRNVCIGDNVIIGAGSVVVKDCLDNGVYCGNPAKRIMSIEDYYKKRKELQLSEAKKLAENYFSRYNKIPDKDVFHEYFMLFSSVEDIKSYPIFDNKMKLCGNYEESTEYVRQNQPLFADFDEFITYCFTNGSPDSMTK